MTSISGLVLVLSLVVGFSLQGSIVSAAGSTEAVQIDREMDAALKKLFEDMPEAETFLKEAKGIIVFPNIVKGGFLLGAQYGKGALKKQHCAALARRR